MLRTVLPALVACAALSLGAAEAKRDAAVVEKYIRSCVGEAGLREIAAREGGGDFLRRFFSDRDWMEQFAGSGPWSRNPYKGVNECSELASKALSALDLLVWNDRNGFIGTRLGRNIATALALSHGHDFHPEKLVGIMELYREWAQDGTLLGISRSYDVREWREVLGFGQNAELDVASLDWIHDFAYLPPERYGGLCWACHYRTFNCFGSTVHGPDYYMPWRHRMNTQELRYRVGGVCGALSKFGSHGAEAHGLRSFTAGQPGHCAYLVRNPGENAWQVAYSVTGHTSPHDSLGGFGITAIEEQDRYYSNPNRMAAEYLRWQGRWEESMRKCPGNWCAAVAWFSALRERSAPKEEFDRWAKAVLDTFSDSPAQGWQLYLEYMKRLTARDAKLAAAKLALAAMKESRAKTAETPSWEDIALRPLGDMFKGDEEALWGVFEAALDGQAGTPTFFRQTVAWGADRLMGTGEPARRFLSIVSRCAEKYHAGLDYNAMVLKASQGGDVAMFRQVCSLMRRLAPGDFPRKVGEGWPKKAYGGELLSAEGMLRTSSTCGWDRPSNYMTALVADDFGNVNSFHTDSEDAPWGMVVLPGPCSVTGIVVANTPGQNSGRQPPITIWTSEDGTDFREVYSSDRNELEWKCQPARPVKAKYIKVGRTPGVMKNFFHLRKILVYGKKLY